jgi:hypothetical protein
LPPCSAMGPNAPSLLPAFAALASMGTHRSP